MTRPVVYLILLYLATVDASDEVYYIIRPQSSQSQHKRGIEQSSDAECRRDNDLTLSQFTNNTGDYLTNGTRLIFSPGISNYRLESEFVVENIHSFSMFVWPGSSSKAVITCGHNARFELRNVSTVTVSGLEFVGYFENHVVSVCRFQLKNKGFFGSGQAIVNLNGTVTVLIRP